MNSYTSLVIVFASERERDQFVRLLERTVDGLDTLAQMQALVGSLGMAHRAQKTEETLAALDNYVRIFRAQIGGKA